MRQQLSHPWTLTLLVCLFVFVTQGAVAAPRAVATVNGTRGLVQFQRRGAGPLLPLGRHTVLAPGDLIRTGPNGGAEIFYNDRAPLNIGPNSVVQINAAAPDRQTENPILALFGMIRARLFPGQRVRTPISNIVVRGTDIVVSVARDGTTTLTVVEGEADFSNTGGPLRKTVRVAEGTRSVVRPGRTPTPPEAVDVSGAIAWTADVVGLPLEFEQPSLPPSSDWEAEAARFGAAIRSAPNDAGSWVGLGQARRGLGDLPGALAAFAQAQQISPNGADARVGTALTLLSQDRTEQARAVLAPVRDRATVLAVLGLADLHEGRGGAAAQNLQAALARDPTLSTARALLALAFLIQNRLPDALAASGAAVATQPDSAQTQGTRAMVLFFAGRPQEAEAASRKAVAINPQSPFALLTEGRALLARQRTDAARAAYERAEARAPNLWLVHQELGAVYLRLDLPERAFEEYRAAVRRNPGSADAHTGLGLALQRRGRYADAEAEHRAALALDPNSATAHYNLATLFIERGRLDDARRELESGVRAAPERGLLYARLAELSLYRQDLFAAQEFARRAVGLLPDSALAHYELGRVYLEQERTVQAEQEFRQATTLDRQFAPARFALGLTEERAETGQDLSRPLGAVTAASQSGASGVLNLQNLQTAGAPERIQAAIQDPTIVRIASRSFGDAQFDARAGAQDTSDFSLSFLRANRDQRGEAGLTAQRLHNGGVRANARTTDEQATVILGGKAPDNAAGVFFLGRLERVHFGLDTGTVSAPLSATRTAVVNRPFALLGFNYSPSESQRTRALVEYDTPSLDDTDAKGFSLNRFRLLHAELRHDVRLGVGHLLSLGVAAGDRRQDLNSLLPPAILGDPTIRDRDRETIHQDVGYVRDEIGLGPGVMLTGEIKVLSLTDDFNSRILEPPDFYPRIVSRTRTTVGLPNVILTYQPDKSSGVRLRARRLFGAVQDFELLSPSDVFLFSVADVPGLSFFGNGWSEEFEYDHTFRDASSLRIGVFQQDLGDAFDALQETLLHAHFRGLRVNYEGVLNKTVTFFLNGDVNDTSGTIDVGTDDKGVPLPPRNQFISLVPRFTVEAGVQFLNRAGWFLQPSFGYVGPRLQAADTYIRLGGFGILNLRAGRRFGLRSTAFVEITNVLDRDYTVAGQSQVLGELGSGRLIRAGLSLRF